MTMHRQPDFLIIGTMKSGTTTLASYLNQSEDIYIPSNEIHFFNNEINYQKGAEWYSMQFLDGISCANQGKLIGDKTVGYSWRPQCAQRIKDLIPHVKLIWIFREPVRRAFSNYLHARKNGLEPYSFSYCVRHEQSRMRKDITKGYVERSKYVLQVERFAKLFSLSDMHFVLFEDMVCEPLKVMNDVYSFLGASPPLRLENRHSNETILPFSCSSLYLAHKLGGYDSKLYRFSKRLNEKLARIFPREPKYISAKLKNEIRLQLQPWNRQLQNLTGLDLSKWDF